MPFLSRYTFILSLLFAVAFGADKSPQDIDTDLLKELLDKRDSYPFIHSNVIQEKELPSLSEKLITRGQVWVIPQHAFRWELGRPVTDMAILAQKHVYVYNNRDFTYNKHGADSRAVRPIMLLLGMGKDASYNGILDNFQPSNAVKTSKDYTITFLPDSGLMKRALKELTICFDLQTAFPKEVIWEQKDGAVITTRFSPPVFKEFPVTEIFTLPTENYVKK